MTKTQREVLAEMDRQEAAAMRVFLATIQRVYGSATVAAVLPMVEARDVEGIMRVLGMTPDAWDQFAEQVRAAYVAAGIAEVGRIARKSMKMAFAVSNPRAEAWIRENSSRLITEILGSQREAIRVTIAEGFAAGRNPRSVALDIVGRIGANGRRAGGVVGLTSAQARYVASAQLELRDPDLMANYFTRARRDRRFDAAVRRAMNGGKPLTDVQIGKILGRYSDRLLQYRGEVIARTETLAAMGAARNEAALQLIDAGIKPEAITKVWRSASDSRVRDTHASMNGQRVGISEAFQSPSGARLRYPGDRSLGAGASETISCRCVSETKVDFLA